MSAFDRIRPALLFIDAHLQESLRVEEVAAKFHFSACYFHRVFTLIVGKSLAAYIRHRRLQYAGKWLYEGNMPLVDIALQSGFESAQSFSRAFHRAYGMPPGAYRSARILPDLEPVESLIRKFTNRLQGGILVNPKIIKKNALHIAGKAGAWDKTAEVWAQAEAAMPQIKNMKSHNGYEVRIWNDQDNPVYGGYETAGDAQPEGIATIALPAGEYASFEVFVQQGYDSENDAMRKWLHENEQGYRERLLDGAHFVVEYYDERFKDGDSGSIVEIWVPIEKA